MHGGVRHACQLALGARYGGRLRALPAAPRGRGQPHAVARPNRQQPLHAVNAHPGVRFQVRALQHRLVPASDINDGDAVVLRADRAGALEGEVAAGWRPRAVLRHVAGARRKPGGHRRRLASGEVERDEVAAAGPHGPVDPREAHPVRREHHARSPAGGAALEARAALTLHDHSGGRAVVLATHEVGAAASVRGLHHAPPGCGAGHGAVQGVAGGLVRARADPERGAAGRQAGAVGVHDQPRVGALVQDVLRPVCDRDRQCAIPAGDGRRILRGHDRCGRRRGGGRGRGALGGRRGRGGLARRCAAR